MSRKPLDWTRTGTVAAMSDWLRESSDAICVLVIRPDDSVFSVDPQCKPEDAEEKVKEYLPWLASKVEATRREKKQAARLELGPCPE
jgi:hypothetical protein